MPRLKFNRAENYWAAIIITIGILVYLHNRRRRRCITQPVIGSSFVVSGTMLAMSAATMAPEIGMAIWGAHNDAKQAEIAAKERRYAKKMTEAQNNLQKMERKQQQKMEHIQNVAQSQQMIANANLAQADMIQRLKDQTNYRNTANSAHIGYSNVHVNTTSLQHMKIM